jgi:hypothetical protein
MTLSLETIELHGRGTKLAPIPLSRPRKAQATLKQYLKKTGHNQGSLKLVT